MPILQADIVRERYQGVLDQVREAAAKSGQAGDAVRVVVVTKTHTVQAVRAALEAGVTEIGENYAEEAVDKMRVVGSNPGVRWHMIGHVQSRKAGLVAEHFDVLHSLDSLRLARKLDRSAEEAGRILPVLLECNVSGETSKYGFPAWAPEQWPALLTEVEAILDLHSLAVRGLMTMPPYAEEAEGSRPFFRRLRTLMDFLREHARGGSWDELSMGTSIDFASAVEEGATLVRVGTAILGPRTPA
jgi:pyridoxal phosphate enzyme (YggS family)